MPKSIELERRESKKRSKKKKDDKGRVCKVWKKGYNCKKGVRMGKKKDPTPRI